MDKESISRLGLDYINGIDSKNSDEIYDSTTSNHIIILIKLSFVNSSLTLFEIWDVDVVSLLETVTFFDVEGIDFDKSQPVK